MTPICIPCTPIILLKLIGHMQGTNFEPPMCSSISPRKNRNHRISFSVMINTWDVLSLTVIGKCFISFPKVRTSSDQMSSQQRLLAHNFSAGRLLSLLLFQLLNLKQFEVSLWEALQSAPRGVLPWEHWLTSRVSLLDQCLISLLQIKPFSKGLTLSFTLVEQKWILHHFNDSWVAFAHFL